MGAKKQRRKSAGNSSSGEEIGLRGKGPSTPSPTVADAPVEDLPGESQSDDLRRSALNMMEDAVHARQETERLNAELRESEGRYRTLTEQVKDYAIFRTDVQGRALTWNQGVKRILGFDEEDFLGRDIVESIFTPEDVESGVAQQELDTAADKGTAGNDRWMMRKNGERFYANGVTTALKDDSGKLMGFTKVMRDATEVTRAGSLIQCQKESLELLLEGETIERVLDFLALSMESRSQGRFLAAIHLMEADGYHFGYVAAPSLPASYAQATKGMDARLELGACSSAVMSHTPTVVRDFVAQERWPAFSAEVVALGLRGCFTTPILSSDQRVVGTFAIYYREPRDPSPHDRQLVDLVTSTVAIAIDHKQAEEKMHVGEAKFRALADNIPQLAWVAEPGTSGQATWFNKAWLEYTGTTLEQNQGAGWQAVHHPDHAARVIRKFEHHVRECLDWEDTFPLRAKNGEYRWFLSRMKVTRDESGKAVRIFGTNTDVTQQREMEDALAASAQRYRVLFDLGPVAVFSCNRDGVLQSYNRRAAEVWGREPQCGDNGERFCGSLKLHCPDGRPLPHAESPIVEVLRTGVSVKDVEVVIERPDGSRVPVVVTFAPLKDERGEVIGAITAFYEITERKRLEEDLRARNKELAEADDSKNQFIAMLSHELRSPLNAIRGWIQIITRPGTKDEDLRKGLDVIDRNSKAQAELISDLLDVHRITAGKVRLELAPIDLREVIGSAVDAVSPAASAKEIRVERELGSASAVMSGDSARLQQVLSNLLGNAVKFTLKGGKMRVTLRQVDSRAEVCVSDTGQGISAAALPHVFQPFRQADPLTSRYEGGLGLGLAISKQLVELHGGTISANSPGKGKGATFTLSLPLLTAEVVRPTVRTEKAGELESVSLGGILVLVVDDEADAREPLRRVLEAAGAETIAVASVDEALEMIARRRPDVLVSDIAMPGRDGYDLMRSICALPATRGKQLAAIALTAYATTEDRDRSMSAGFQTHLTKPVESVELVAAVAALAPTGGGARRGAPECRP